MFAVLIALIATSAHAERPSLDVLDDIDRWDAGQNAFLAGPAGCWDLSGEATQIVTLHQPPDFFSAARNERFAVEGTIAGRLVDGIWQGDIEGELDSDDHKLEMDLEIVSLFGAKPEKKEPQDESISISLGEDGGAQIGASIGQASNVLREAIEETAGDVETSLSQWDDEQNAVLYLRELPLQGDNRPIKVTVRFPDAGPADRIDAVWPQLIKIGEWPLKVKIRDAQMHVVGHKHGDVVLPWAESLSFVIGALGYTAGFEQSVKWTSATPCTVGE